MSPRSPSLSEGEISSRSGSRDEEKVTKNAPRYASTSVNTSPRHTQTSSSRASHSRPSGRDALMSDRNAHFNGYGVDRDTRDRSRSPFRRERSGSRSPFRADRGSGGSGGEKRRRQDDHYGKSASDTRRHKVYEDRPAQRGSYRDTNGSGAGPEYANDKHGRNRNAREPHSRHDRDRSRSPYRAPGTSGHERPSSRRGPSGQADAGSEAGDRRRASTPSANDVSGTKKEISQPEQPARQPTVQSEERYARNDSLPRLYADAATSEPVADAPEPQPQLSEAELIEQRRKKREAIRKKHAAASAGDSLLRTTLESNLPSASTTPYHESSGQGSEAQSPPSSMNSPRTPRDVSTPGSPASINDEDLMNPIQMTANVEEQGQSAADYDPNQDMHEDRPDHKRQDLQDSSVQANAGPAEPAPEPTPKKVKDDFDMFADDDDDDMFAANDAPIKVDATKQARALDESLLDNWDYPDGHYRIINGELLDGRYAVEKQIGKGTFATVVRARDTQTNAMVAIKIACRNETMFKAGQKEMQFLNRLNEADPEDKKYIIRLLRDFMHKGHLCLVFEGLEMDLRETLKKFGRDVGINPEAIQIYTRQILLALLHMKTQEVLHADLKPDNILVSSDNKYIKLCDFGTATLQQDAELTPYLVSRFYRAPEVILGMEFDYGIDMWSIGCTLYELYTGRILFNGSDNNNMLRVIQECRGKLPNRLIKRSQLADKYFDEAFTFHGLERDKMTGNLVQRPMHFSQGVHGRDLKSRLSANAKKMDATQLKLHTAFVDLLDKCLQLDPEKRIKPKDALRHPFVSDTKRDSLSSGKPKTTAPAATKIFRPAVVQRSG
ncbi:Serine/threonine-protein kinase prp4 [Pseudocercospora fuligena]|uniref:non-specific serine/threonine protein kinase n=1 Tax=Pseudocercospora fuligena TaxID=685502 RepID=A0A8H6R7D2_9PEZI|nr:Serine/threonine-protein kinase prp4 [Pseudocercospora fuligena]